MSHSLLEDLLAGSGTVDSRGSGSILNERGWSLAIPSLDHDVCDQPLLNVASGYNLGGRPLFWYGASWHQTHLGYSQPRPYVDPISLVQLTAFPDVPLQPLDYYSCISLSIPLIYPPHRSIFSLMPWLEETLTTWQGTLLISIPQVPSGSGNDLARGWLTELGCTVPAQNYGENRVYDSHVSHTIPGFRGTKYGGGLVPKITGPLSGGLFFTSGRVVGLPGSPLLSVRTLEFGGANPQYRTDVYASYQRRGNADVIFNSIDLDYGTTGTNPVPNATTQFHLNLAQEPFDG